MGISKDHGMKEWLAILALALFALFAIGFVAWMGEAKGAESTQCDVPEQILTTALQDKSDWPERTHRVLEGAALASFISKASAKGYILGSLPLIDKIYIVDAKVAHGAIPKVWLFLVQDGCVIAKLVADKPQMEECL